MFGFCESYEHLDPFERSVLHVRRTFGLVLLVLLLLVISLIAQYLNPLVALPFIALSVGFLAALVHSEKALATRAMRWWYDRRGSSS